MALPVISFALVITWIYAPTLSQLAHQWAADPNYSHGFLVVPFSAYIACAVDTIERPLRP